MKIFGASMQAPASFTTFHSVILGQYQNIPLCTPLRKSRLRGWFIWCTVRFPHIVCTLYVLLSPKSRPGIWNEPEFTMKYQSKFTTIFLLSKHEFQISWIRPCFNWVSKIYFKNLDIYLVQLFWNLYNIYSIYYLNRFVI